MYRKNGGGVHLIPRVLGWGRSSSIELDVGDSSQEGILFGERGWRRDSEGRSGGGERKKNGELRKERKRRKGETGEKKERSGGGGGNVGRPM